MLFLRLLSLLAVAAATDRQDYAKRLLSIYAKQEENDNAVLASAPALLSLKEEEERRPQEEATKKASFESSLLDKKAEGGVASSGDFLGSSLRGGAEAANGKRQNGKGKKTGDKPEKLQESYSV